METVAGQKEKAKFAPLVPREKKPGHGEKGGGKRSENKWKGEGGGNKERNIDVGKKTGESCEGERVVESKGKASGLEKKRGERKKKEGKKKTPDTEKVRAADEGVPQQQEGKGERGGGEGAKENKKQKNKEDLSRKETDKGKEGMNVKKKKKENEKVRKEGKETKKKRPRDETESNKVLPLTDSQYDDIFDSATALETSVDNCLEDARAVLSEVELLQATIDQVSLREEEQPPRRVSGERKKRRREEEEDSDSSAEFDQWVQCSRSVCGKWRRVERHVDLAALPSDWTCIHDTGPGLCEATEDSWSGQECDVINSGLVPGSLVWAQQIGYPWWPAIVERDPDTKTFCQFNRNTDLYPGKSLQRFKKKLREAVLIATQAQSIPLKRRLSRFGFWTQQTSDRESSEDSEISEVLEMLLDHEKSRRSAYARNKKSAVVNAAKRQSEREQSEPRKKTMKQGGKREGRREDETEGRREGEQLRIKRPGEKEEGVFNRLKPVKNTKSEPIGGDLNEGGKGVKERAGEKKRGEEEGKKRVMTPWLSKLKKGSATTARPASPPSKDQTVLEREREEKRGVEEKREGDGVEEERAKETSKGEERMELREERSLEEEEKEEEEGHESDISVEEEAVKEEEEGHESDISVEEEAVKEEEEGHESDISVEEEAVKEEEEGHESDISVEEEAVKEERRETGEGGEEQQIKKKEGKEFVQSVFVGEGDEGGEDDFLDEDMEILGCREEVMKRLAQEPIQEEEDDFSIMLFEEE
ncbi:zinc finger CW-type PWWP domain protein 1 isoform X3 [Oncorhynchus tshawytscha]|uniref:zinc finger CW-type PWWP domain protein 1 isoform X3 n=1 Tax=Oncorhynchus tshawytscha TaxID=74940 RepID=UPI001C3D5000|nr:zinc finger CW-type PWWP domain protein 1 isoform X3 [Oncorhynchus tshawytscha]